MSKELSTIVTDMITISGSSHVCCGIGFINIRVNNGSPVLIMYEKPLGFDLLLGIDTRP